MLAAPTPRRSGSTTAARDAIHALAHAGLHLDAGSNIAEEVDALLAIDGIGPWIASYVAMRALGSKDAYLDDCERIAKALQQTGGSADPQSWHPYSSYAIAALWRSLDDSDTTLAA